MPGKRGVGRARRVKTSARMQDARANRRAEARLGSKKSQPKMTGQLAENQGTGQAGAAAGDAAAAQRWVGRAR